MLNLSAHLQTVAVERIDGLIARKRWDLFREMNGFKAGRPLLSAPSENMKLAKDGVLYGLSLARARTSDVANTCPFSTRSCRRACVAQNGNGRYSSAKAGRALRVKFLIADPSAFVSLLAYEIDRAYAKHGDALAVRLNTFSDLPWERIAPWLFSDRRHVRFYDYSKDWTRAGLLPLNYHVTFSASDTTSDADVEQMLRAGHNVAVVFSTKRAAALPTAWNGWAVIDGDKSDVRDRDPRNVVVGLRAKGQMTSDPFGMVRKVA